MHKIGKGLWVVDGPFRFAGIEFGNRMTLMQSGDGLLLHSPLPFDERLLAAIQAIGEVKHLIAPNREHNLHVQDWRDRLPGACLWAPPGAKKLHADRSLVPGVTMPLRGIQVIPMLGIPRLKEWVFVHEASATLVITDLAFHFVNVSGFLSRLAIRAYGCYGRFGPTYLVRMLVKDRVLFKQSLREVLQYPFDNIIMSHGTVITGDGMGIFSSAFANYL